MERNIIAQEADLTVSGNGAVKFSTTGDPFVDDFGSIANFRNLRDQSAVDKTMALLWAVNPLNCLKEMVYIRSITRDTRILSGLKIPNKGQGLKHEFFCRLLWLAKEHPESFYKNLPIFVAAGSWDDIFELMRYDLKNPEKVMKWGKLFILINECLKMDAEKDLIKKYLPTIKSRTHQNTERIKANAIIGNYICMKLWPKIKSVAIRQENYRKLKSSGVAHEFQQQISQEKYGELDFNKIPGRVINKLIEPRNFVTINGKKIQGDGSTFIDRHGLTEKFDTWLDKQPIVKFNGYPYELFKPITGQAVSSRVRKTINKQFEGLIHSTISTNMFVALDVSPSMRERSYNNGPSALQVAASMALVFGRKLEGIFKNTFMTFSTMVECVTVEGVDAVEDFNKILRRKTWGSTDFLNVARKLVELHTKHSDESEFPTGCLVVSDGEFDRNSSNQTTFKEFLQILRTSFSEEYVNNFKLVLWDVPSMHYGTHKPRFESYADYPNFFYMSGFDPTGLEFLTGKVPDVEEEKVPQTASELFATAMDQKLLNLLLV